MVKHVSHFGPTNGQSRRDFLRRGAGALAGMTLGGSLLGACGGESGGGGGDSAEGPIKVGLLNSLSGGLSIVEVSIHNGAALAIAEINANGGVAGRQIEPIIEDYASNFDTAVQKARKLVSSDEVAVTFGCYTSASRKSVLPVFTQANATLMYSTFYEGLECSENVFYTGAVPTQQLTDFTPWVVETLGKRVYIVGSDYIYPRTMSEIEQKLIADAGGEVVGDRYFPLDSTEFAPLISSLRSTKPDVVISNLVGASIPAFYKQFRSGGFSADDLPIAATVTTEQEVQAMGARNGEGHYMSATYFQSLDNPANRKFVKAYKDKYGAKEVTNMPMVGMYDAVYLWKAAVEKADGDISSEALRKNMPGVEFADAPEGVRVTVAANHHVNLPALIGQCDADGQYKVVEDFGVREPDPFPEGIVPAERIPECPTSTAT